MEKPCRVFCCYAREDQALLYDLRKHLRSLERDRLITVQADIDIDPGKEWEQEIDHYLDAADIILLLISPDFIDSDYCFNEQMQKAITRHKQGTAHVVPIIIRPTDWQRTPFGGLQCLPKDGEPVSIWKNVDNAFLNITEGIHILIQKLSRNMHVDQEKENLSMPPTKEDPSSASGQGKYNTNTSKYNFSGPVHANVIGDNTHINTINNIYEDRKDGMRSLEKGSKALWNGDYRVANKELRTAIEEIDQEEQKREAAKARYLQALAVLGQELPRHKGVAARDRIDGLLNTAINLDPSCRTYTIALAMIKTDICENNSLRERQQDVYKWQRKANSLPGTAYDEELLSYLAHCQPRLYHQTWWVRKS